MINRTIAIYESLFSDPVTIQIRFRYATTGTDGSPLQQGLVSQSDTGLYILPWNTYISALRADARTNNDDWQTTILGGIITSNQVSDIQNSGHAPTVASESAIIANLQPGNYTAIVSGVNNTTGVALVEVYDLD